MNPRVAMLYVLIVPGLGLAACGRRAPGVACLVLFVLGAALPGLSAGLAWLLAHALAVLVSIILHRRRAL